MKLEERKAELEEIILEIDSEIEYYQNEKEPLENEYIFWKDYDPEKTYEVAGEIEALEDIIDNLINHRYKQSRKLKKINESLKILRDNQGELFDV